MFFRPLLQSLCLLGLFLSFDTARGGTTQDVAAWDRFLATVPKGATTVALGDQVVPLSLAVGWRNELAAANAKPSGPVTNAASQGGVMLWPGGNVYYTFTGTVSANHQVAMLNVFREWETTANVHFIPRTTQANYVAVNDGGAGLSGGNSAVGMMNTGAQALNIGASSWYRETMLHEVGHALGLIHEHQRSDRDTYVTIAANYAGDPNFLKAGNSVNRTSYDFLSIMHYQRNAFSSDGTDTITPKPAYVAYGDLMGRQFNPYLSRRDRTAMANMYGTGPAQSLVVTTIQDSGVGSLRAALMAAADKADDTFGLHPVVTFQIPNALRGTNTYFTIALTAPLQPRGNANVNAGSQTSYTGNTNTAGPEVLLTAAARDSVDPVCPGVQLNSASAEVYNFIITGFSGCGVEMTGATALHNVVAGCFIGTDYTGATAAPNRREGIWIHNGANDNLVGGNTVVARNIISGNTTDGVLLSEAGTTRNRIQGNYIGLNAAGDTALPNGNSGIYIYASAGGNIIGGTGVNLGNVISGNSNEGIGIEGPSVMNSILSNYIGTDPTGGTAIPNLDCGILIFAKATNTIVGGATPLARNVISGNTYEGILVADFGTNGTKILGNYIGTNVNGDAAVGNGKSTFCPGISVSGGPRQTAIGAAAAAGKNVLSGNGAQGVGISGATTAATSVYGNYIGVDATGTIQLPNGDYGVAVFDNTFGNVVGGVSPGAGNIISGNNGGGIFIRSANSNYLLGNYIGLSFDGLSSIPNNGGISIDGTSTNNLIGSGAAGRNYIAGNYGGAAISIEANGNFIIGNTIGLTVDGGAISRNGYAAIILQGNNNIVGGLGVGEANLISGYISQPGVLIAGATSTGNTVSGNSIYNNGGLPIVLDGGGDNDAGDSDTGPNGLQNYPILTAAVLRSNTTVDGSLNSTASKTFRLEFFASADDGNAGGGAARTFIGAKSVTTNASGNVTFSLVLDAVVAPGLKVTATATNLSTGDTSPMVAGVAVTTTDADHDGLPDSWENANGYVVGTNESALDSDSDGQNTLMEFYAGTNPRSSSSVLGIASVQAAGNDNRVTFLGAAGRNYRLEYSDHTSDSTAWRLFGDQLLGSGGNIVVTDPGAILRSTRAYRLKLQQ